MASQALPSLAASAATATGALVHSFATKVPDPPRYQDQARGQRDLVTQIVISITFGFSAFITFCVLRPKWSALYAARRKMRSAASTLPDLPDSMFGWIPVLYNISDEQVLASGGLDAFVFLLFYRYSIHFLTIVFFFSVVVILPVRYVYTGETGYPWDGNRGKDSEDSGKEPKIDQTFLWLYVVFSYVFTAVAVHLLIRYTNKIIQKRQTYLGGQTTMADRTLRLSGIPVEMRSEKDIQGFIEGLEIGKVENVMLCRDWSALDGLMAERKTTLQRLEEAWAKYLKHRGDDQGTQANRAARITSAVDEDDAAEDARLLSDNPSERSAARPKARIWFGPWNLRSRSIDAIDYHQEKLRQLDEKIEVTRQQECSPGSLAFVTMDSIAACQVAVQAILNPSPMQLVANLAPAPADVVWHHTYLSRAERMVRGWTITAVICFLTVFWSLLLVPLAYLLNLETLEKVIPRLAETLAEHPLLRSLMQTGLPTLTLSLLALAVPYIYDWLANVQGMTSQGDVELSVISKYFFFTFFNLFLVFTVFATASNFYGLWENLRDVFKDTTTIAFALASSLEQLAPFYTNLIVLQGLGLFPFRLLEFGSVFLYPFQRMCAVTPRDHAELRKPPIFSYGFALPPTMFIFIVCIVYSVFPSSWLVCLFGLIYFTIGQFIYKYQLLYAMDHQQHSTGRAWPMICSRIILGLVVFQLTMIGSLALRSAITRSIMILPLLCATVWFSYFFTRTYDPLMKFIALRSIDRGRTALSNAVSTPTSTHSPTSQWDRDSIPLRLRGRDVAPRLKKYINPNLIIPLDSPWIEGQIGDHYGEQSSLPQNDNSTLEWRMV